MFFVLSGFILSINYARRGKIEYQDFLAARIARIYPLYLFAALVAIPFFISSAIHEQNSSHGIISAGIQILLCVTLLQAWFPMLASVLNPPGWSLSAEWFFYSMFPIFMNTSKSRRFLSSTLLAIPLLWVGGITISIASAALIHEIETLFRINTPTNFTLFLTAFNPILRFPEFLIGCSLGLLHLRGISYGRPGLISILAFLGIASLIIFMPITKIEPILHTCLLSPLFGLFIYALANTSFSTHSLLTSKFMTFLGESSYALYILHEPIRGWMGWGFDKLRIQASEGTKVTVVIISCILISGLAFIWIESPARPWIRALLSRKKLPPAQAPKNLDPV
jgi:peptidoglycan/LPS O-acetylase OafA/YrhL